MNIAGILKKVGGAVIRDVIPGGGLVLDTINAFLPEDQRLGPAATGSEARAAINSLPPEQQVLVMTKELDVQIAEINAWPQVVASLAQADASGASTRPEIAVMMAKVVAFAVIVSIAAWAMAVFGGKTEVLKALNDSWGLLLAILGTPTALLRAYFGLRSEEKKARYSAATGGDIPQGGLFSSLGTIIRGK